MGVMVAPLVPNLSDHEIPAILKPKPPVRRQQRQVIPLLRLNGAIGGIFEDWLRKTILTALENYGI